jgi:hypothetical protein
MSYNNKYSNKPFESASKTGHTSIINDKEVKNFLSNCHIPSYDKEVSQQDMQKYFLRDIQNNPIKNIIAIDGGFTDVYVRKEFPSSTIAFFQFGALFFKYQDLIEMEEKPFIDPDDFSKLQNMQRMKLILPTKGVTFKKEIDLIDSVRKSIYDFFVNTIENQGLIKALTWLIFEEYNFNNTIDWTIAQCPHCKEPIKFTKNDLTSEYTLSCPHCQETIYLTDVFRLHEVIDNELGAGGVLGYLCTTIEQLIIVYLIKEILNTKAALLKETLIVKDGPLAFFGQTANIHKPMKKLIKYLNKNFTINLVGLEKSGAFVEHAEVISDKLEKNQIILLGNNYIYKYILPGQPRPGSIYGETTYYSHKLIYKSKYGNIYIASIPAIELKAEPDLSDYINLSAILNNISYLKCDLYYNSLVPVVLANKLVSLSDHPSADILKTFAQQSIS